MGKVIGVRFKKPGKIYFFNVEEKLDIRNGDNVIVETTLGQEFGTVTVNSRELPEEKMNKNLRKIIRIATKEDKKHNEENLKKLFSI